MRSRRSAPSAISFDNALAETVNGYYKAELIRGPAHTGPWKTVEEVELATLGWVHWHNTQRLHGYLGDIPPVEFEQRHGAQGELNEREPDDPSLAEVPPADPLSEPHRRPLDREIAAADVLNAATGSSAPAPWPPWPALPPGAIAITCGSPGPGIQRAARRPRTTK